MTKEYKLGDICEFETQCGVAITKPLFSNPNVLFFEEEQLALTRFPKFDYFNKNYYTFTSKNPDISNTYIYLYLKEHLHVLYNEFTDCDKIKNIIIHVPSVDIQYDIVSKYNSIVTKKNHLMSQIDILSNISFTTTHSQAKIPRSLPLSNERFGKTLPMPKISDNLSKDSDNLSKDSDNLSKDSDNLCSKKARR